MTKKVDLQQQWNARISAYRSSGLTLRAWCAINACTVDQMKYWLYKANKRTPSPASLPNADSSAAPSTGFAPLAVIDEEQRAPLLLRIGSVQIELHSGFDRHLLREVVQVLKEAEPC